MIWTAAAVKTQLQISYTKSESHAANMELRCLRENVLDYCCQGESGNAGVDVVKMVPSRQIGFGFEL